MKNFLKPFDLASGKPVRVKLVNKGEYHLMMFDMHHIVGDGASDEIFKREFMKLYNGEKLESLTHQFKDYSEWMRTRDLSDQAEYWKSQFEDEIPVLDMPTDFQRPQEQSYAGSITSRILDEDLSKSVKDLVRKSGATEYMVFLAAAMVMLSKYSRQEDIVIGSPISGRTHKDTEGMLGMFVNTLAMRGKPEKNKSFKDFLKEIKETCLKAYENQEYPFEELVEAVEVRRDMSRNPLFDVMLVLQNNETANGELSGAEAEETGSSETSAKFDLTFNVSEFNGKFGIGLEYCTALFRSETADRILAHFIEVLKSITANPEQKISYINIITQSEKTLWEKYNSTYKPIPDESLENLVCKQCQKTPQNVAIINGDESVTYGELWEKAEKIAGYLRSKGLGKNDCVAVSGERSIWTVINIVGILAAGCAYVPQNPEYPEERNEYIVKNSQCKLVLNANSFVSENMSEYEPYHCESDPYSIAYTIYTSGSTGVPKGVVIKHNAAANTIQDINDKFEVNEKSCIIGLSAFSFDLSVYDIFGALSTGARLIIVNDQRDAEEIQNILNTNEVTFWNSVPAIMSMYLMSGGRGNKHLRNVLLSGDWIPVTLPDQIKEKFYNAKVCSLGGATEGAIWSIYYPIEKVSENMSSIPYGIPLANQQMLILNEAEKLCPIGAIGEICIGGKGVAEGYANQAERTAAVFVENSEFGRIYHTGDIGRMHSEGFIEFMGRLDDQVKIRGFRIELGEIESRIREIEGIKDCAVIARADSTGDKAIYAYFTSDEEKSMSEISDRLSESMPEYMIPAYMMQIESIPVTRNGKLDKRALPEIEAKATKEYIAPRNEIEEKICSIFSEILN
ncbi:amino acid adenylation domain-containing protein, partial [Ruminococcus flavefaciens]|uniref:non-ribosomal peptide synthetase n=1 Tax=Ruminococcus flavefaciens TaxID=1265 RepID=UPI0026EAF983